MLIQPQASAVCRVMNKAQWIKTLCGFEPSSAYLCSFLCDVVMGHVDSLGSRRKKDFLALVFVFCGGVFTQRHHLPFISYLLL